MLKRFVQGIVILILLGPLAVLFAQPREESDKDKLWRCLASYQSSTASLNAAQQSAGDLGVQLQRAQERIQQLEAEVKAAKEKAKEETEK